MMNFSVSRDLTVGTEIELQVLDSISGDLTPKSDILLTALRAHDLQDIVKPEITKSMLEIATSAHENVASLECELKKINKILSAEAEKIDVCISGGGTHPFQVWKERTISLEYEDLYVKYDFLAKKFTVFGQHIHIGCSDPNKAIYLIHAFSRYIPHLIALSASSPFYDGVETAYHSTRLHMVDSFYLSGHFPVVSDWDDFQNYMKKLKALSVISHVRNFYWDIRLRPEFGTLEIRICDAPLTPEMSVALVAYCQTLAFYFLEEMPIEVNNELYLAYAHNRFQASRYGFMGEISIPGLKKPLVIRDDILSTFEKLRPYVVTLNNEKYFNYLEGKVYPLANGAEVIKKAYKNLENNVNALINFQSNLWMHGEVK